jgi:hypothetical protein
MRCMMGLPTVVSRSLSRAAPPTPTPPPTPPPTPTPPPPPPPLRPLDTTVTVGRSRLPSRLALWLRHPSSGMLAALALSPLSIFRPRWPVACGRRHHAGPWPARQHHSPRRPMACHRPTWYAPSSVSRRPVHTALRFSLCVHCMCAADSEVRLSASPGAALPPQRHVDSRTATELSAFETLIGSSASHASAPRSLAIHALHDGLAYGRLSLTEQSGSRQRHSPCLLQFAAAPPL